MRTPLPTTGDKFGDWVILGEFRRQGRRPEEYQLSPERITSAAKQFGEQLQNQEA
jgi:hypothetical protein